MPASATEAAWKTCAPAAKEALCRPNKSVCFSCALSQPNDPIITLEYASWRRSNVPYKGGLRRIGQTAASQCLFNELESGAADLSRGNADRNWKIRPRPLPGKGHEQFDISVHNFVLSFVSQMWSVLSVNDALCAFAAQLIDCPPRVPSTAGNDSLLKLLRRHLHSNEGTFVMNSHEARYTKVIFLTS